VFPRGFNVFLKGNLYMKRKIFFVIYLRFLMVQLLFSQSIDEPALKLDLPLFNLPYQINAAKTLEHGFFESYTYPGMEASLNITGGVYSGFHYGLPLDARIFPPVS
jgi:hypothetical protein